MNKMTTILLIAFFLIGSMSAMAVEYKNEFIQEKDGSILLPVQKESQFDMITTNKSQFDSNWQNFIEENNSWTLFYDKQTQMPHRAFGKPIQIDGYSMIDADNVKNAALEFVGSNFKDFGLNTENLRLRKKVSVNNVWSLSFIQQHNGIDVMLSEVELRIRKDGKVMAFGIDYFNEINVNTNSDISTKEVKLLASQGLSYNEKMDYVQTSNEKLIIPVRTKSGISFSYVEKVDVNLASENKKYSSYVDLNNKDIVWRRNLVANVETEINAKGMVKLISRLSPETEENFDDLYLIVNGVRYQTDEMGKVTVDIDETSTISAKIEGEWAKVIHNDISNANYSGTVEPGETHNLLWDDSNSHRFERYLYQHATYAHEFYKMIDPVSEAMDFQLGLTIYNQGQPNAGSDLENGDISFVGCSNTSAFFVESPSVLFHEYGHSINTRLYRELGISEGMISMGSHEATADLNAAFITDEPRIGYLAFADSTRTIRNLVNNRQYPRDVVGESHHDGEILGGAFWDLRLTTDLDYARWIVHYAKKMGTPDDADLGKAYSEWFIETLIADDTYEGGDNDLSNGTPHSDEIIAAFNKHKIGTNLAVMLSFEHQPYEDTKELEIPYTVTFKLENPLTFIDNKPQNVLLAYSTDDMNTVYEVEATEIEPGVYSADIPAQEKGSIVEYYIQAEEKMTNELLIFSANMSEFDPYRFFVGYEIALLDDFEYNRGWVFGVDTDDATYGLWEIADPDEVTLGGMASYNMQPGDDFSDIGTKCLVTGAKLGSGQSGFLTQMPNGTTSVLSPIYDITTTEFPILRYYSFFFNAALYIPQYTGNWVTYLSSDGGNTWLSVENTTEGNFQWTQNNFFIEEYVEKTNAFRVKFEVTGVTAQGQPMSLTEGLVDDFQILTINENANIIGVEDSFDDSFDFYIYPNPASDKISITSGDEINSIAIYNVLGEKVYQSENINNNSSFELDLSNVSSNKLQTGVYLIQINSDNNFKSKKLIIE